MLEDKDMFHQILIIDEDKEIKIPECTKTINKYFDVNYKLWTNSEIRNFISENFENKVLWAYDFLKPYAFKADLARYCILYKLGGWYSDINNTFIDLPPDTKEIDFIFFMDIPSSTGTNFAVSNGLMYSSPGNEVYMNAIHKIISNCVSRYYGPNSLFITGPAVIGLSIYRHLDSSLRTIKGNLIADYSTMQQAKYTLPDNRVICLNKSNKNLPGGVVGVPGTNNYNILWNNREVFGD